MRTSGMVARRSSLSILVAVGVAVSACGGSAPAPSSPSVASSDEHGEASPEERGAPSTTEAPEPTADELLEHRIMFGYYRDGYWNETRAHFGAPTAELLIGRRVGDVELVAFETPGGVVHTTVGLGWPPPGSRRPPVEIVAIANAADERIFEVLLAIGELAEDARPDRPLRTYHAIRFLEPRGLPPHYFVLDGGLFGLGYDAQRLIVVPVTDDEYGRFEERDEAVDQVQTLSILGLAEPPAPLHELPAPLRARWH